MLTLKNFLRMGVAWSGPDAERLQTRRCRVLLEHIAAKVQPDRPCSPVRLATRKLSDDLYRERAARMAIAELVGLGVIQRERQRAKKEKREDVALTRVHPDIVVAAARWTAARQALRAAGKRGKEELPPPVEITVPLFWPGEQKNAKNDPKPQVNEPENEHQKDPAPMEMKNPPKSAQASGNPHGKGLCEEAACKDCSHRYAKIAGTGIPHPPALRKQVLAGVCRTRLLSLATAPPRDLSWLPCLQPLDPRKRVLGGGVGSPITINTQSTIRKSNGRTTAAEQMAHRRAFRAASGDWKGSKAQADFFECRRAGL